jgi:Fe-S-cluster containining protein
MPECNGCGACCGPASCTDAEARKIARFIERKKIEWVEHEDPLTCGFYDIERKRCRIYSVRPFPCRAFGVVKEMGCPLFPKAAKQSLPPRDAAQLGLMAPLDLLLSMRFAPDGGQRQFDEIARIFEEEHTSERALTEYRAEKAGLAEIDWKEGSFESEIERVAELIKVSK